MNTNALMFLTVLAMSVGVSSAHCRTSTAGVQDHETDSIVEPQSEQRGVLYDVDSVVWAVNVGGDAYRDSAGVYYAADDSVMTGDAGYLKSVSGAQDDYVYKSYRMGQLQAGRELANGVYDITFHFAEPEQAEPGERTFDVVIQGETRINDLDVSGARGGAAPSALMRTVRAVSVERGRLEIRLQSDHSVPIISAFVVRERRPSPTEWELIWADEFSYSGQPDPAKWSADIWEPGTVNREAQAYTDDESNLRVENGRLILEAHRDEDGGSTYTSARIHSRGKGDFLYGRVDIRAKLPRGRGTWAALWMLPSDPYRYASNCDARHDYHGNDDCDAWPNSGEIDIMEYVGYDRGRVHGTVHNRSFSGGGPLHVNGSIEAGGVDQDFFIYSLVWTPDRIDIFMDGTWYYSYFNDGDGWRTWPFDHPFHIIMNLAIGGTWGETGGPVDDSIFPVAMEVDYVRVFKPAAAPVQVD